MRIIAGAHHTTELADHRDHHYGLDDGGADVSIGFEKDALSKPQANGRRGLNAYIRHRSGYKKAGQSGCVGSDGHPILRISASDLDNLIASLEVSFATLSEHQSDAGRRLSIPTSEMPGLYYHLAGGSYLRSGEVSSMRLVPHTLVIVPPGHSLKIENPFDQANRALRTLETRWERGGALHNGATSDGVSQVKFIHGYFRASYGAAIDLFSSLTSPIIEHFDAQDRLDDTLKVAAAEIVAQKVGMGAMTAALLKQVLVILLRRSLVSANLWVERFSVLRDPQIARAFSEMVGRPGAAHSVKTLSETAGLSRSLFMARFTKTFGRSPMSILRDLRMRQASLLLASHRFSIEQVAYKAGYSSRSSFFRAYRKVYGSDPHGGPAR